MIYCTARSALCSSPCLFFFFLLFSPLFVFFCLLAGNFGPGNGKQLYCQKGVFWFIKSLECYLFCSPLCSPLGAESWHPNETEWVLAAQFSILRVIYEAGRVNIHWHRRTDIYRSKAAVRMGMDLLLKPKRRETQKDKERRREGETCVCQALHWLSLRRHSPPSLIS